MWPSLEQIKMKDRDDDYDGRAERLQEEMKARRRAEGKGVGLFQAGLG